MKIQVGQQEPVGEVILNLHYIILIKKMILNGKHLKDLAATEQVKVNPNLKIGVKNKLERLKI